MKGKKVLFPLSKFDADIDPRAIKRLKVNVKHQKDLLCELFINAVNRHDGQMIMDLAKAVWFFKDKRHPKFTPKDKERTLLLMLKMTGDESGKGFTIREVAKFIALDDYLKGKRLVTPEDGFSALRRKCIKLGIKIIPSRKIKKK